MKEVIKIFEQLKNTASKKEKEKLISSNSDNELFKQSLLFLLDDNIQTGIGKKSLTKNIKCGGYIMLLTSWVDCMSYLKENNTGKDYDILVVQGFIAFQDEKDRWFYEGMITKTLKIGCDKAIVNKAIPGLIPEWKVQLGSPFEKLRLKHEETFFLSKKMNGFRGTYLEGEFKSRQGKKISGMNHIIKDIEKLGLTDCFIDGELIRKNPEKIDDNENFRLSSAIINSEDGDKKEIEFVIFDIFQKDRVNNEGSIDPYSIRKKIMLEVNKRIQSSGVQNVKIVDMVYEGNNIKEIERWLEYGDSKGWEGLILNKDAPYKFKRTTDVIKVKTFYSADLKIIGYKPGNGKHEGRLGSFVVDYKGNPVDIGYGYSDEEREQFWKDRDSMIGKIMEIKYKDVSKNKRTGQESLQFAGYVSIRYDKTEPSYN